MKIRKFRCTGNYCERIKPVQRKENVDFRDGNRTKGIVIVIH